MSFESLETTFLGFMTDWLDRKNSKLSLPAMSRELVLPQMPMPECADWVLYA